MDRPANRVIPPPPPPPPAPAPPPPPPSRVLIHTHTLTHCLHVYSRDIYKRLNCDVHVVYTYIQSDISGVETLNRQCRGFTPCGGV